MYRDTFQKYRGQGSVWVSRQRGCSRTFECRTYPEWQRMGQDSSVREKRVRANDPIKWATWRGHFPWTTFWLVLCGFLSLFVAHWSARPCLQILVVTKFCLKKVTMKYFLATEQGLTFFRDFSGHFSNSSFHFSFWNSKLFGAVSFCRGATLTHC